MAQNRDEFAAILGKLSRVFAHVPHGSEDQFHIALRRIAGYVATLQASVKSAANDDVVFGAISKFHKDMGDRIGALGSIPNRELAGIMQKTYGHVHNNIGKLQKLKSNPVQFYTLIFTSLAAISTIVLTYDGPKEPEFIHRIGYALVNQDPPVCANLQMNDSAMQWEAIGRLASILHGM
jgi:hypothetical protein